MASAFEKLHRELLDAQPVLGGAEWRSDLDVRRASVVQQDRDRACLPSIRDASHSSREVKHLRVTNIGDFGDANASVHDRGGNQIWQCELSLDDLHGLAFV